MKNDGLMLDLFMIALGRRKRKLIDLAYSEIFYRILEVSPLYWELVEIIIEYTRSYQREGKYKWCFNKEYKGTPKMYFNGITTDGVNIYTHEGYSNRIIVFNKNGGIVSYFDIKDSLEVFNNFDMTIHESKLYISNTVNKQIQIFDISSVSKICYESKFECYENAECIRVYRSNIYISYPRRNSIIIYAFDGSQVDKINPTFFDLDFMSPYGFCILDDKIYITDSIFHRVLCFSIKGEYEFCWGNYGDTENEFNFPHYITSDDNFLYVKDMWCIRKYDKNGIFINRWYLGQRNVPWWKGGFTFLDEYCYVISDSNDICVFE